MVLNLQGDLFHSTDCMVVTGQLKACTLNGAKEAPASQMIVHGGGVPKWTMQ